MNHGRIRGYSRVSTADQGRDDRWGRTRQLAEIQAYARRTFGLEIAEAEIFSDTISGTKERREAFERLIETSRPGDVVVIPAVNRLGRKELTCHLLFAELVGEGLEVHSAEDGHLDPESDSAMLMLSIKSAMSASDLRTIRKHTLGAKIAKARGGEISTHWRALGYGYRRAGRTREWYVIPEEARVVERIAEEILAGRSCDAIAAGLNASGLRTIRGKPYSRQNVRLIAQNPAYRGELEIRFKSTGEAFRFAVPPILDAGTWEAVQRRLVRKPHGVIQAAFDLAGVLKCGACGYGMIGRPSTTRKADGSLVQRLPPEGGFYTCHRAMPGKRQCSHKRYYRALELHALVGEALARVAADPAAFLEEIPTVDAAAVARARAEVARLEGIRDRLTREYEILPGDFFAQKWRDTTDALASAQASLEILQAPVASSNAEGLALIAEAIRGGVPLRRALEHAGATILLSPDGTLAVDFRIGAPAAYPGRSSQNDLLRLRAMSLPYSLPPSEG